MLKKAFAFLLFFDVMLNTIHCDIFEECEERELIYLEVEDDCSFYIFCHGEDSFRDSCPEDNPYFSVEEQTCDMDRSVCKDRPINEDSAEAPSSEEENSTAIATIAPPVSTSSVAAPTSVPSVMTTTSTGSHIPSTLSSTAIQTASTAGLPPYVVTYSCPPVDDLNKAMFVPHTKSCSDYFLCFQGKRIPLHCSHLLHFDARQQKCDYPQNVKCQLMEVATPREQCRSHTLDFYPHPTNCNYYYRCTLGYLQVLQCPLHMGWHYEKRACVMRSQAKCYNTKNHI